MTKTLPARALFDSVTARADALRALLGGIDPGAASVRLVSAGIALGALALLVTEPAATRFSDSRAEMAARIAPVGSVSIARSGDTSLTADADADTATVSAGQDS